MRFLPININIEGKRILIIGGGRVGLHKATILQRFTDDVVVISPAFRDGFSSLPFTLVRKDYESSDLDGVFMVYICTENEALNKQIKCDAAQRHILASVCDNPQLCDFTSPAIYRKDHFTVAVASDAKDVRGSMRIRDAIRDNYPLLEAYAKPVESLYALPHSEIIDTDDTHTTIQQGKQAPHSCSAHRRRTV